MAEAAMALRMPRIAQFQRERATPRQIARMISESGGKLVEGRSAGKYHSLSFEFKNVAGAKGIYRTLVNDRPQRKFLGVVPTWAFPLRPHVYVEAEQTVDPRRNLHLSSKITLRSRTPEGLAFVKAIRNAHAKQ